jgi:integrase
LLHHRHWQRCELALKYYLADGDWNTGKGATKPRTEELKQLNNYLEGIRAKLFHHYQDFSVSGTLITAEAVKNAYLGIDPAGEKEQMTLRKLVEPHNQQMEGVIKPGTTKNYRGTAIYVYKFLDRTYPARDIYLKDINYQFITAFEYYIRNNPIKKECPCTNNGAMKNLERLKKILLWAIKNEWMEKNPFSTFKLRYKPSSMEYLREEELARIEQKTFGTPMLEKVRDFFVFSCYTGLAYIDLVALRPYNILTTADGLQWIRTTRKKTDIPVNVPLLPQAVAILEKYWIEPGTTPQETVFPYVSNQEVNRSLKQIAGICEIPRNLTFHCARHTFATTVTLLNGVPLETISKMLGHSKITTTMRV